MKNTFSNLHWVIDNRFFEIWNWEEIIKILDFKGIRYSLFDYVPFSDSFISGPIPNLSLDDKVILFGCVSSVRNVGSLHKDWTVWNPESQLCCSHYLSHLGKHSIHQDYTLLPFNELLRQWDRMFDRHGVHLDKNDSSHIFVRPNSGDKLFNGGLVGMGSLVYNNFVDTCSSLAVPSDSLILVSTPSAIKSEYRFFVNRSLPPSDIIFAGTSYMDSGIPSSSDLLGEFPSRDFGDLRSFVLDVVKDMDYYPDNLFCIDIAELKSGEFRLLEIGSVTSAGLYGINLDHFVDNINNELSTTGKSVMI